MPTRPTNTTPYPRQQPVHLALPKQHPPKRPRSAIVWDRQNVAKTVKAIKKPENFDPTHPYSPKRLPVIILDHPNDADRPLKRHGYSEVRMQRHGGPGVLVEFKKSAGVTGTESPPAGNRRIRKAGSGPENRDPELQHANIARRARRLATLVKFGWQLVCVGR